MKNLAIIEIPKEKTVTVFTTENGLDPYLEKIKTEVESFVPDLSTKKGRDAIASLAYKVSQSKTALESIGKDLVAELKKQPKLVDTERKRVRDYLDDLRDEVRQPLTDWEADQERLEAERIAAEEAEKLRVQAENDHELALLMNDKVIADRKAEAEQIEADRLAAEEEIKRNAAEQARIEAEQKATEEQEKIQQEKLAAEEAAKESERQRIAAEERVKLQAEQAETARIAAEQQAIQDAKDAEEREKQAVIDTENRLKREAEEKQKAEAAALARREANKKHAKKINNEAANCFVEGGFDVD